MSKKRLPIAPPETTKFKKENNKINRCHAIKKTRMATNHS